MVGNIWRKRYGMYEILPGADIQSTISDTIRLSKQERQLVVFEFNGIVVSVLGDSDAGLIYRDWSRAMDRYIGPIVGPHPIPELSKAALAVDEMMERHNKRLRDEFDAQRRAEDLTHRQRVQTKLADAPPIDLADPEAWQSFVDTNGAGIMVYPEQWARLMQLNLAQGKSLADIAEETSHEADTEGITGAMYGFFVGVLAQCWTHGEELRHWHNRRYQLEAEGEEANESGGVLNPALIHVEPR
jgi:hypothetical protein